jgi:uncharacterized membrane protein
MFAAEGFELVFRTVHIMAGVAWAGSAFLFAVFIEPAAAKLGPAAGPFMEETIGRRKAPEIVTAIAAVTVIAGWVLWFRGWDRVGSLGGWLDTSFGLVLTIGGLAATGAFLAGLLGIPPNLKRLNEMAARVEASGGVPTPEQATAISRIQARMRTLSWLDLSLLAVAVFCMATARAW